MDDTFDKLVIDVRANTQGFAADLEAIKTSVDTNLLDGFDKAGRTLERGLLSALKKGSLGFDDLKRVAFQSLDAIASQALHAGIGDLFGSKSGGGIGSFLAQSLGGLFGSPGRATGGPVSPGRGYIVGENGPELFVPTSSGRVERNDSIAGAGRDVRVAISVASPRGTSAPVAMRRSSRQVAAAVRQALQTS
jgi:hypothetical protein